MESFDFSGALVVVAAGGIAWWFITNYGPKETNVVIDSSTKNQEKKKKKKQHQQQQQQKKKHTKKPSQQADPKPQSRPQPQPASVESNTSKNPIAGKKKKNKDKIKKANKNKTQTQDTEKNQQRQVVTTVQDPLPSEDGWETVKKAPKKNKNRGGGGINEAINEALISKPERTIELGADMGAIYGKGGSTLQGITESTGAKIEIEKVSRTAIITGTEDQVAFAASKINSILAGQHADRQVREALDAAKITEKLPLNGAAGFVIGKGGSKIKDLTEKTQAHIQCADDVCTIRGLPSQVKMARDLIEAIIKPPSAAYSTSCPLGDAMPLTGANLDVDRVTRVVKISGDNHNSMVDALKLVMEVVQEHKNGGPPLENEFKISLSKQAVGAIVGVKGQVIHGIESSTGAQLRIAKDTDELSIGGTKEQVAAARVKVEDIIANLPKREVPKQGFNVQASASAGNEKDSQNESWGGDTESWNVVGDDDSWGTNIDKERKALEAFRTGSGSTSIAQRRAEAPWGELTVQEKVIEGTKLSGSVFVLSASAFILAGLFYNLGGELFSVDSKTALYLEAYDKIKKDVNVQKILGSEVRRGGDQRPLHATNYRTVNGDEFTRMEFLVEGNLGKAIVHVEAKKNGILSGFGFSYSYLKLQAPRYGSEDIIIDVDY
eukprot:UC4_evm4s805